MLIWTAIGVVAAIGVGWIAAVLSGAGWAPVVIFPLGVGAALGAILSALAVRLNLTCRKQILLGTVLLALVAIFAEHAWLYRDFRQQWREAFMKDPRVALFRSESPWSPREYFTHELKVGSGPVWCMDGALIIAAAAATVIVMQRQRAATAVATETKPLTPDP